MESTLGCTLEIVKYWWTGVRWVWMGLGQEPPTLPSGFHVLPRRWVAERTFAWLLPSRQLSKDYEELPATSEALISWAMSRLMLNPFKTASEIGGPAHSACALSKSDAHTCYF
jgi:putative transposase